MPEIRQGCVQTHIFTLPAELKRIKKVAVAYIQGRHELSKLASDCGFENKYSVLLEEDDTLRFCAGKEIIIQVKAMLEGGSTLVSKPFIAECTKGMNFKIN